MSIVGMIIDVRQYAWFSHFIEHMFAPVWLYIEQVTLGPESMAGICCPGIALKQKSLQFLAESMNNNYEGRTDNEKRSTWPKVVDLVFRSSHIGTSSVLFGGIVWAVPYTRVSTWHHLAIATGILLIILNIRRSRHWPYQGRGVMAWLHIGLVWLVHVWPAHALPMLATALAIGVVGSHMPGVLRHWSFIHRRRID